MPPGGYTVEVSRKGYETKRLTARITDSDVTVPVTLAFLRRIRIEERVLAEAFPEAYPAYARTTWRLLPYVW